MQLDQDAIIQVAQVTGIHINQVTTTCNLLFSEECTIPFIARYRKEATGNLDELQIKTIQESYEELTELKKRKAYILDTLKKNEKLTPALEKLILSASTLIQLEDIYAPHKTKRKTKATIAKEKGLEPLADHLLNSPIAFTKEIDELIKKFVEPQEEVQDINEAINGACDILMERFAQNLETKEILRKEFYAKGLVSAAKKKKAEEIKDYKKYQDFFEYQEQVQRLLLAKNSHRFLAISRGVKEKVLSMSISIEEEFAYNLINSHELPAKAGNRDLLEKVVEKAYKNVIAVSLELELKSEIKKLADEAAINVFSVNLESLLLQPYLGSKSVLGIDPGIRTGCKLAVVNENGQYLCDQVIYPFAPQFKTAEAKDILIKLIEHFKIFHIAIGNGTNGRETMDFVKEQVLPKLSDEIKISLVNEDGASIYSASEVARDEFPDLDITVRGAISIARRFQDPLAELVKIDPKSLGVGQYQHDVNQLRLKKTLEWTVEKCVNYVGVDLNTASAHILSYISGIGPSIAKNIVKTRQKQKGFVSRDQLLEVPRLSQKVYQQAAGFLRIYQQANPLDETFIHPEHYQTIEDWCKKHGHDLSSFVSNPDLLSTFANDRELKAQLGELTFKDIVSSLKAPKQDPRDEFSPIEFKKDLRKIDDLNVGEWYTGVVNNITHFGAFVDLGIKESGLLHISQISHEYVENSLEKLKVGEVLKVKVTEVDLERKRISLSTKENSAKQVKKAIKPAPTSKNNAFAGLKNFKVR